MEIHHFFIPLSSEHLHNAEPSLKRWNKVSSFKDGLLRMKENPRWVRQ